MLKQKILVPTILISTLLIIISTIGCTTTQQTKTENNTVEKPLFIVTDTGYTQNNQSVYIELQNIDTKQINCFITFTLQYLDEDSVGAKNYGGGTTEPSMGPSGIYTETQTKNKILEPHKNEQVTCYIHEYSGYTFLTWDYEIIEATYT